MTTSFTKRTGRKRGNNEGSIKLRSDGRYEARVTLPDGRRKSYYGKTRAAVQRQMTAALRDVQQGKAIPSGKITVGAFLDRWLEDAVKPKNAHKTYTSYKGIVDVHVRPALGKRPLATLTASEVQRFLTEKGKTATPSMVKHCRDILRIALGRALRWQLVTHNAAALTEPPRVEKGEVRPLRREQVQAIRDAFVGTPYEMPVMIASTLGLRRGEVLGLTWRDIDCDAGTLTVRQQVQWQDGAWRFVPPKSKESRRTLPMPRFLTDALRQHRTRQLEHRLTLGAAWQDLDLVCASATGTPMDAMNLTHRFQAGLTKAGLPRMRFHDLRHAAATVLLNNGFTLKEVQEILGHSTFRMTADIYGHLSDDVRRDWGERMQRAIGGD